MTQSVLFHVTLQTELERRRTQKAENIRRRHNYVPFIVELLRCLAEDGKLVPLVKEAQERKKLKQQNEAKTTAAKAK